MNGYLILPLFQAALSFALMLLVMVKGRRQLTVNRLFVTLLLCLGVWGAFIFAMRGSPDTVQALFWERLITPIMFFIPTIFYHFSVVYAGKPVAKWFITGLYLLAAASIPLSFTGLLIEDMQIKDYGYAPVFGWLMTAGFLHILLLSTLAMLNFRRIHRNSPDPEERSRALYVMLGIVSLVAGAAFDVLPTFGLPLYPGFIVGIIIFTLLTTVVILRHNLLDIHVVLRKSAAYFLTTSLFLAASIILSLAIATYISDLPAWIYVLVLSVFTLTLPVIFAFFQRRVDRWFYRERYEHMKAMELFSRQTESLADRALGEKIIELLTQAMRVSRAHIALPASAGEDLSVVFSTDVAPTQAVSFSSQSPLMKSLTATGLPVARHELEYMPQFVGRERTVLLDLDVELVIPGRTARGDLAALVVLGKKLSFKPYSVEEKQLLQTFVDQMVTKLENNLLYADALQMREQLEGLSRRLVQIQEDERRGIARELHDEIGQSLVITKMLLDRAVKSPLEEKDNLVQAQVMVKEIIGQVREMSLNLRPSILDDLGLLPAVRWFLDRYTERTGIQVDFHADNLDGQLPGDVRITAYRVVQEGLNNIAKHARTDRARLTIGLSYGNLHIEIMDSGAGFDPDHIPATSAGLSGMRERVGMLGGTIRLDSSPGAGTWVGIDLPVKEGGNNDNQGIAG